MGKKKIGIAVAIAAVLGLGLILYKQMLYGEHVPAADEIAVHIQFDIKEDVGLSLIHIFPKMKKSARLCKHRAARFWVQRGTGSVCQQAFLILSL